MSPTLNVSSLEWGRKRGRPARSSLFAIFQGEKLVRQEIATFPVLRRVGNTDDGKTNVQFLGRAAHLKLDHDSGLTAVVVCRPIITNS